MSKQKEEEILKIIEYVKAKEYESGLTEEKIVYKYTFGECSNLAHLIKKHFEEDPSVWIVCFTRIFYDDSCQDENFSHMRGSFWHVCIGIGQLEDNYTPSKDSLIFDINGVHTFERMEEYLSKTYSSVSKSINYKEIVTIIKNSRGLKSQRNDKGPIEKCYEDFLKAKREFQENGEMQ